MVDGSVKTPLDEAATVAILKRLAETARRGDRGLLPLVDRQPRARARRRAPDREAPAGRPLHAFPPHQPVDPRIPAGHVDVHRRIAEADDECLSRRAGGAAAERAGFGGRVLIITSQGGVMDVASIAEAPVQLVNSGPSMGPVGALAYGSSAGTETLIVGDAGGTTFDVSLVRHGRIPRTRETWLGRPLVSHMTGMPSVDVKSIGAGGGSIAWVDQGGLLHVGPISAGAMPGPAAYGRGGTRPTVTDAALILGFVDPDFFLGGLMSMDVAAAEAASERDVADPLGKSLEEAAIAVIELATENMVQAIMDITVNQGIDPTETAFVAGGGAGGLNCVAIARRLGCRRVLVPEPGAALAAAGALISDLTSRYHAMFHAESDRFDREGVNAVLARLEERCLAFAAAAGAGAELSPSTGRRRRATRTRRGRSRCRSAARASTRRPMSPISLADFHRTHQEVFAVSDPASPIETIGWNAEVRCRDRQCRAGPRALGGECREAAFPARALSRRDGIADRSRSTVSRRSRRAPRSSARRSWSRASPRSCSIPARSRRRDDLGTLVIDVGA